MKQLIFFLLISSLGFSQANKLRLSQIEYAPGAGYVPYTDATGKQTYSLLTTVSPTTGLLPSTTSITINGSTQTFTSTPVFTVQPTLSDVLGYGSSTGGIPLESPNAMNSIYAFDANAGYGYSVLESGGCDTDDSRTRLSHSLQNVLSAPTNVFDAPANNFPNATANTVSYFDASKNIVSSTVTPTELNLLGGVTGTLATTAMIPVVNEFRLTLTSGVAVTTSDVINASTVYCTPFNGNKISLYNGTNWVTYTSNEFSLALGTLTNKKPYDVFCYANAGVPTLEFLAWTDETNRATALTLQDGFLVKSGATTRRYLGTFYNQGNQTAAVTISNATPAVITYSTHGLTANTPIVFTTSGALPNGLVAGTTYYIASIGTITDNTFNVSATPGGALINTTTAGSGTHTITIGTYVEDSEMNRYLWNYYNQSDRFMYRQETATSWNYTTATRRVVNGNQLNSAHWVSGIDCFISSIYTHRVANTTAAVLLVTSHGLDSYLTQSTNYFMNNPLAGASFTNMATLHFDDYVVAGKHFLSALEFSAATGTTTWYGAAGMSFKVLIKG